MKSKLYTAPTVEPVSLLEIKRQLSLGSVAFDEMISTTQSIAPGAHVIAATYSLEGSSVDISGNDAMVVFESGTNGTGGTVDIKVQDSSNGTTWADVASGSFTQVTTANDNTSYEILYTGRKQYLRAVATVGVATCDFGVTVVEGSVYTAEDDLLTLLIGAAREHVESFLGRALITQTWDAYFDRFPSEDDYLELPASPLQSVTTVYYTDSTGKENTFAATNYDVNIIDEPGQVKLGYNKSWPSTTLRPMLPVRVRFIAGYGDAATNVPKPIRQYISILTATMFAHREKEVTGTITSALKFVEGLIEPYRVTIC